MIKSRMRWVHMEERRNAYDILTGKSEGRKPLGRIRHNFDDNSLMAFRDIHCGDVN
jgi:hypothetical protein